MFESLISTYANLRKGAMLSDQELAELIVAAKEPHGAHAAVWSQFRTILQNHTDLDAKEIKAEFRKCRITSDLGVYPYGVEEFVPAFLQSRGHVMKFTGSFGNDTDGDFIFNKMSIWSSEIIGGAPVYPDRQIQAAFDNWKTIRKSQIVREHYAKIAFDPSADATELDRFATYITATTGDPAVDARNVRATVVALKNFIFRVKNHMRSRWYHGVHMMPVLYGPQGSGKTTAVRHLLTPLEEVTSAVGFDVFDHDAKMFTLSTIPVMFFDELAGISKAENERLKDIMHSKQRELRQPYGRPVNRTLVASFIGCSNKEIATLIKDETGNRRYYQIDTKPKLSRDVILQFDALAIWRAVDEDGEPPLYANAADLAVVQSVQAEQRHQSNVDEWLADDLFIPVIPTGAGDLFADHFIPWMGRMYPGQDRFENVVKFGKELQRMITAGHPRLSWKYGSTGKKLYTVTAHPDRAEAMEKIKALKLARAA